MENKYFSTFDYNKFTINTLHAKVTQTKLVNEPDIYWPFATKVELKAEQDKTVKLQTKLL